MVGDERHVIPPMSKHGGDISPPSPPGFTPLNDIVHYFENILWLLQKDLKIDIFASFQEIMLWLFHVMADMVTLITFTILHVEFW